MSSPIEPMPRQSLQGDDVVFMYPAADVRTYADYGCTFLAWGGAAGGKTARELQSLGVHSTGSLWCLTAGAKQLHENADLRDAVARDIEGNPIPVWWLFDQTFEGTPSWFGCTNHPAFRAFVRQRTAEEMRGGAMGLHVDDHLGTAHAVAFLGGCFCDYCMIEFRNWLDRCGTAESMRMAGVSSWEQFDYRSLVRRIAVSDAQYRSKKESIPLYSEFLDCQLQLAAENVRDLGALAREIVRRPITLSANVCLPELPHLAVTKELTHLVGEVNHRASEGVNGLIEAVNAYRMADALGKPIAATAKGQDWALVKATGKTNLVKIWIALGYCAGQRLMAPHRQWCYTNEKGSHWYDGPSEAFAPLYRFVRKHPELFRDTSATGPLSPPADLHPRLDTSSGRAAFAQRLEEGDPRPLRSGNTWIFPRRSASGSAIIHVLNIAYSMDDDAIEPQKNVTVTVPIEPSAKGVDHAAMFTHDANESEVRLHRADGGISFVLPELRLWAVIRVGE